MLLPISISVLGFDHRPERTSPETRGWSSADGLSARWAIHGLDGGPGTILKAQQPRDPGSMSDDSSRWLPRLPPRPLRMDMDSRPAISCSSRERHPEALRSSRQGSFESVFPLRFLGSRLALFHSTSVWGHAEGWATAIDRSQGAHGMGARGRRTRNETRNRLARLVEACGSNRRRFLPRRGTRRQSDGKKKPPQARHEPMP